MRYLSTIMLAIALAAVPARGLAVEPPTSTNGTELTTGDASLDGQVVQFEGEVISESLSGGPGHVWVNVLSGGTAIGAWMPEEMAADIEMFGDWQHVGDVVSVTGVFNVACDDHGGDLDVHATQVEVVSRGSERERPVAWWKLGVALVGVAVAFYGYRRMRRGEEERPDV